MCFYLLSIFLTVHELHTCLPPFSVQHMVVENEFQNLFRSYLVSKVLDGNRFQFFQLCLWNLVTSCPIHRLQICVYASAMWIESIWNGNRTGELSWATWTLWWSDWAQICTDFRLFFRFFTTLSSVYLVGIAIASNSGPFAELYTKEEWLHLEHLGQVTTPFPHFLGA